MQLRYFVVNIHSAKYFQHSARASAMDNRDSQRCSLACFLLARSIIFALLRSRACKYLDDRYRFIFMFSLSFSYSYS